MTTTTDTCGYGCNDFNLEPHEMCAMCRNRLPTMTTTDTRNNLINSLESALQDEWCTLTTRSTNYAARVVIQGRIAKLRARLVAACKAQHAAPIAPRGEDYQIVGSVKQNGTTNHRAWSRMHIIDELIADDCEDYLEWNDIWPVGHAIG